MTVIVAASRVRLKPAVELTAASFRVCTISVLLGIGSVDASLNTNSTSACTFDSARVLATALEKRYVLQLIITSIYMMGCGAEMGEKRFKKNCVMKMSKSNLTYNRKWLTCIKERKSCHILCH